MCSPIKNNSGNAQAARTVNRLLAVEHALIDPEVAEAVTKSVTCSRAALVIKELVARNLINNQKDPTNAL